MVQSGKSDWFIYSRDGQELAGPYATKSQALCERLEEWGKVTIKRKVVAVSPHRI